MEIAVENINVTQVEADLLVLKYADRFYGADKVVAEDIGFYEHLEMGQSRFCPGRGIGAREVLFIGVGRLTDFRYERIEIFGANAVRLARLSQRPVHSLATTIHGPGYGLDPDQAFLSMISGFISEWRSENSPLRRITVVDIYQERCERLQQVLKDNMDELGLGQSPETQLFTIDRPSRGQPRQGLVQDNVVGFGTRAEQLPKLFIAMPFAEEFIDEFEIGFHEAAKASDFICERLDMEAFTGDIVSEIKRRIVECHGVVGLLNGHNPNVFLEIGFAWAHNKPTILVAKYDTKIPFDVGSHKCIRYQSITELRKKLSDEIAALKSQGVLVRSA